jgi:hypothetical protein
VPYDTTPAGRKNIKNAPIGLSGAKEVTAAAPQSTGTNKGARRMPLQENRIDAVPCRPIGFRRSDVNQSRLRLVKK